MTPSKFFRAGLGPWLLSVAALGCSSGGGGGGSTLSDFCKQWADAYCQIAVNPCGLDMGTCTTYQTGQCMMKASVATTGTKRIFTPGNTGDCINKIKSAYGSTNPISASTQASIELACQYVFQGPGKTGTNPDTCTTQFDCAGATDGSIICDANYHVCASKTTVSGTGACMNTGDVCSTNFYCAPNSQNLLNCTAEGQTGASCASAPCDSSSRCLNGTCMALAQPGGSCNVDSDCMNNGFCDHYGTSPTCDDGLQFAKSSQTCTCIAEGMNCPGSTAGAGGQGGMGGSSVSAGGANGAAGATGTGGASSGTGGTSGTAGSSGAAGAAGGAGGA